MVLGNYINVSSIDKRERERERERGREREREREFEFMLVICLIKMILPFLCKCFKLKSTFFLFGGNF